MSRPLTWLIALIVLAGALLFLPLPIPPTFAGRTIENAGHFPLFFLVALGLLFALRDRLRGLALYAAAGGIGVGLGFLSEVIQRPLKRDASWEDVAADALGVLCALALYALFDRRTAWQRWHRVVALTVATACMAVYVAPIVTMGRAYLHRNGQFPVLADFRSPLEWYWVRSIGVRRVIVGTALEVQFAADARSGVEFHEPVPDWRGYRTLLLEVENPGAERLELGVYVHDERHKHQYEFADRFNRSFLLGPGERRILRIDLDDVRRGPRNRPMDMDQISNVALYRDAHPGAGRLRIHILRLE